jgi:hypothetical protein
VWREDLLIDISHNPRLSQLLGRIEEIRRVLGKLPPDTPERSRYEHALAGFYIEVGKYVHWLMRQDPSTLARVQAEGRRWASEADAFLGQSRPETRRDGLRVGMPAIDATHDSATAEPTTGEEMSVGDDWTQDSVGPGGVPIENLPDIEPDAIVDDGTAASGDVRLALGDEPSAAGDPVSDLVAARDRKPVVAEPEPVIPGPEPVWSSHLRSLMSQLGQAAISLDDPSACEMEKRRLVRATTNMETRWAAFPPEVKRALLGCVSSRAQAVRTRMAVDVELRLALGRMKRFRDASGVEPLASLGDEPAPERGSWEADAAWWWERLLELG